MTPPKPEQDTVRSVVSQEINHPQPSASSTVTKSEKCLDNCDDHEHTAIYSTVQADDSRNFDESFSTVEGTSTVGQSRIGASMTPLGVFVSYSGYAMRSAPSRPRMYTQ